MATNLELRQLFQHGDLRNRIEPGCIIAATAVLNEAPGTENHSNRVIWALAVFENPSMMAARMHMALLGKFKDSTTAQIMGVADATLNTAIADLVNAFAVGS